MGEHEISPSDLIFRTDFEAGRVPPAAFDHRAHLRLAYVYLAEEADVDRALARMRNALQQFIRRNGVEPSKYHETLTHAWLLAVRLFMQRAGPCRSSEGFLAASPVLLDPFVMMTHYSREVLFSDAAREAFVAPDLSPIPTNPSDLG